MSMLSESARMSSAAEARFRIASPAVSARVVKVIDLESATDREVARLVEEVPNADLIVMIASAGADAHAAAVIGEACSRHRVMTTAVIVRGDEVTDEVLSATLAQVRPWSLMVVVASDEDYVGDILRSLR
jgi:hypothetical protein